jgi:hypothetical protein
MTKKSSLKPITVALLLLLSFSKVAAQFPYGIVDQRQHAYCKSCQDWIYAKPKEVLFGIAINPGGDIYFSMSNMQWFNNIFKTDSYGLSIDIVSKKRYQCGAKADGKENFTLPLGTVLPPVYKKQLINGNEFTDGNIWVKVGKIPTTLSGQELEGNLIILNGNFVCYYSNFINIERSGWQLLPMGLFTDSLIRDSKMYGTDENDFFTYTKKEQLVIPFEKGSASFNTKYLRRFFDSLNLGNYKIRKPEIRAYSSVEGQETVNKALMKRRADTIVSALKQYHPGLKRINIITAENWLEFFQDIAAGDVETLKGINKNDVRKKLTDKALTNRIEPMLSKHRKAVIVIYLEGKSKIEFTGNDQIVNRFNKAIVDKDITNARQIQKEIADQVADNNLPATYMDKLEIPGTRLYSPLLNDREVYKYLLKTTSEYEAYENFLGLQKIDPDNGHIQYNICALSFFMWQFGGDTSIQKILLDKINRLPAYDINNVLVKRMQINYHILKCEEDMQRFLYDAKDSSVEFIYNTYKEVQLDDDDIYSLAKYFANYAKIDYAEEIVTPRIDKIDVNEDLLFFYINTQFYYPDTYETDVFNKAVLNAVALNPKRYCNFFLPNDKGGASMQLLEYDELKRIYCESCR